MSNETKWDVFVDAVDALADAQASGGNVGHQDANLFMAEYDDALPDDLPVIPKEWGDTIEEFKTNHYRLSEIFTEWDWNYDEQELIARAWLDGYEIDNKS
ncbi:MAG: DUF1642 domain-containing protein [Bacillota bacterium]|nr:DUF1642 domain-containing protein [Bacillota bacterium]